MASLYRPGVTFRCLDGSKEVPWDHVNDDYCDCADGSDEPGNIWALMQQKLSSGFMTKRDSYQTLQLHRLAKN